MVQSTVREITEIIRSLQTEQAIRANSGYPEIFGEHSDKAFQEILAAIQACDNAASTTAAIDQLSDILGKWMPLLLLTERTQHICDDTQSLELIQEQLLLLCQKLHQLPTKNTEARGQTVQVIGERRESVQRKIAALLLYLS